ncbi:hypothetical protein [Rhodobacter lacus]|uniref:DUF2946 domain-containing protein n=1 Tax=Rhodobacter lacus TaxID=1641972 RepID=A0ABW5A4I8_9RHOB
MSLTAPLPARPLRHALPRALALLAMLVQVLFFAEHLGAAAVHEMGAAHPGARLGFLQICTGEGVALYDPASGRIVAQPGAPAPTGHSDCAVCASAGVCSFDTPVASLALAPIVTLIAALAPALFAPFGFIAPLSRSGQIRAPPQA